jgi:Arc/MetJ-type ribon-helix-helix transcriptional regulator
MSKKELEGFNKKLVAVGTKLPEGIIKLIEKKIIPKEFVSMSDYLRHLIREDLKKRGISTSL